MRFDSAEMAEELLVFLSDLSGEDFNREIVIASRNIARIRKALKK
jgi:hypothetical protein